MTADGLAAWLCEVFWQASLNYGHYQPKLPWFPAPVQEQRRELARRLLPLLKG